MDDTQEWINFLYNRAENLEKSLPRPERYLTPPLVVVIFGGLASIVGWLGGWLGSLGVWWEKLLGSILIAIIIVIVCIAGGLYGYWP